ncbi:MAG: hypothetical protein ACKVKV_05905 [Dehalococcoidia bacterium]
MVGYFEPTIMSSQMLGSFFPRNNSNNCPKGPFKISLASLTSGLTGSRPLVTGEINALKGKPGGYDRT